MAKKNRFQKAVEATPDIQHCYQKGLQALGGYHSLVVFSERDQCEGSVDIDSCTTHKYPTSTRWDYVFGFKSKVYFVEVHSAETGEVNSVLKKLQWLKDWLARNAPELNHIKADRPYYWIQSGRFSILKNSPQYRRIVQEGLAPIPMLKLE